MLVPVDDFVGRSIYFFRDLDPKITALIKACLSEGDVAFDIGSNLGVVAVTMAQCVGPTGKVHAFEPAPRILGYLAETLVANPSLPIMLHGFALGDRAGELTLFTPPGNAGNASLASRHPGADDGVTVEVKTLSQFVEDHGIDRIDFIKIDVEGFESQVLAGGADAIASMKPKFLAFEEHGLFRSDQIPESIASLMQLGYRIFGIKRSYLRLILEELTTSHKVATWDYVAVSSDGISKIQRFIR